jgi:hypothetical protein
MQFTGWVDADDRAELQVLVNSAEVPATVATRARIVLWHDLHGPKKEIAAMSHLSVSPARIIIALVSGASIPPYG